VLDRGWLSSRGRIVHWSTRLQKNKEKDMTLKDALLAEFDHEIAVTRKVLERVAPDKLGWTPHDKSMTLGRLATHVAEVPQWGQTILQDPEFNMTSGEHRPPDQKASVPEILDSFDKTASSVRALLASRSDADLMTTWSFKHDGAEVFAMPRAAAWRTWVMNHMIHHRGQLSVYLRQTGSLVPAMYGPSADER
jgi:uncharacterized damage-inducible protein DinB